MKRLKSSNLIKKFPSRNLIIPLQNMETKNTVNHFDKIFYSVNHCAVMPSRFNVFFGLKVC